MKKCASCNFEAVEGVNLLDIVHCLEDVVGVQDEHLKTFFAFIVG